MINTQKSQVFISIIIGTGLFIFICYKAYFASFTYDESVNYYLIKYSHFESLLFANPANAANHVTNSVLLKLFTKFGSNEFLLRLPSILSYAGLLIFSLLLSIKISPKHILPVFLMLNLNVFLIDFFALSRGYGLSLFFTIASIFYYLKYLSHPINKYYNISITMALLAAVSHYALIYFFVSLIMTYNIIQILRAKEIKKYSLLILIKSNKINFIVTIFLIIFVIIPVFRLKNLGLLYAGGETGFWSDSIGSLIRRGFYGRSLTNDIYNAVNYILLSHIIAGLFLIIYLFIRKNKNIFSARNYEFIAIASLLFWIFLFVELNHYAFDTKIINNRYSLFLYLLIIAFIASLYSNFIEIFRTNLVAFILFYSICGFLIYNTILSINIDYFADWKYDSKTKAIFKSLKEYNKSDSIHNASIGTSWVFEPTAKHYINSLGLNWISQTKRFTVVSPEDFINSDFYFITNHDKNSLDLNNIKIIDSYVLKHGAICDSVFLIRNFKSVQQ